MTIAEVGMRTLARDNESEMRVRVLKGREGCVVLLLQNSEVYAVVVVACDGRVRERKKVQVKREEKGNMEPKRGDGVREILFEY